MNRILQILLFISVLQSTVHAETTREDVDNYLEVSRGGVIVNNSFVSKYKKYFSLIYGMNIEKADKTMIKKYEDFIFSPKYKDIFYKTFTKLDDTSYYEIMAFYKTTLGKKYTKYFRKLYTDGTGERLWILLQESKGKPLLSKKRKLVTEINRILYSRFYTNLGKKTFTIGEISTQEIANTFVKKPMKKNLRDEYVEIFNELAYRCFSDEELSQILEYAKTYGKIEMGFLDYALRLNTEAFKKDLDIFLKEKALKENNNTNSKIE